MEPLVLYLAEALATAAGRRLGRRIFNEPWVRRLDTVIVAALRDPDLAALAPESERSRFLAALAERPTGGVEPPAAAGRAPRAYLREAIQAWVAPLEAPVDELAGQSYLAAHAIDPALVVEVLYGAVLDGISGDAVGNGPLKPYDDVLRNDRVIEAIGRVEGIAAQGLDVGRDTNARVRRIEQAVTVVAAAPGRTTPIAGVDHFTGRADLMAYLADRLTRPNPDGVPAVVAVDGGPGIGKSALVRQVARVESIRTRFPDGIVMIDLFGWTPGLEPLGVERALEEVLRAIGIPADEIPAGLQARLLFWRRWAAGRNVLIILDNAHHEAQVELLLPGDPGCAALITSRQRLSHITGCEFRTLTRMPEDEVFTLLSGLVGSRAADGGAATDEIVRWCAGWPLVARVAAGLFQADDDTDAAEVASLLTAQAGSGPVRASLQVSYDRLNPGVQLVFRRLALLDGSDYTPFGVALVTNTSETVAARRLRDLARAGLIESHAARVWRAHDLVREFARSVSDRAGEPEANDRAAGRAVRGYLAMVREVDRVMHPGALPNDAPAPPLPSGLKAPATMHAAQAWLRAERANIIARVRHEPSLEAAWLADFAGRNFRRLGDIAEAAICHDAALEVFRREGDQRGEASALLGIGDAEGMHDRYAVADEAYDKALELSRAVGDHVVEAKALAGMGENARMRDQPVVAERAYTESLSISRAAGDLPGEVYALVGLADLARAAQRNEAAEELLRESLEVSRRTGDPWSEASALLGLANVLGVADRQDEATGAYAEALRLFRESGSRSGAAAALAGMGDLARLDGRIEDAETAYHESLRLSTEIGNRMGQGTTLVHLAHVALQRDQFADARRFYENGRDIAREVGNRWSEASALAGLGDLARLDGRHDEALELYEEARLIAAGRTDRWTESYALLGKGYVHSQAGESAEAQRYLNESYELSRSVGDRWGEMNAASALGYVLLGLDQFDDAEGWLLRTAEASRDWGYWQHEAGALVGLGRVAAARGDRPSALRRLEPALAMYLEHGDAFAQPLQEEIDGLR
ncbi:MAG TPA: tetratricopeptide repeat protein [Jiangellaceae bacterium]